MAVRASVLFDADGVRTLSTLYLAAMLGLAVVHLAFYRRWLADWWRKLPQPGFVAAYAVMIGMALVFSTHDTRPFIYFQF